MFDFKEIKLMFNDPLDQVVFYINATLIKNKIIKSLFS